MDRPCYEVTFFGVDEPDILLKKALKWLKSHQYIFVKEIIYSTGEMNRLTIYYEGFPDKDPHMMEYIQAAKSAYWEQNSGRRHPERKPTLVTRQP
jgi:hypothetical protein